MSLPTDVISNVQWSDSAQRWYWTSGSGSTGFVSEKVITAELAKHQQAMQATLKELVSQVYAGDISVAEFETAFALEIKNAAIAQAIFANGGVANMTPADWGRVGQTLREQYGFLDKFGQGIADGSIAEGQAGVRVGMYGDATEQAYWDQWRANRPGGEDISHLPKLQHSPRDGYTQCLTRCRCELIENDDGSIDWIDNEDAAECDGCYEMASGGPYRP